MIELQDLTERILISALREQDAADAAETKRRDAQFLADAGLELSASLDEESTYSAIANLTLPRRAAWCVVDVVGEAGSVRRVAVIHPDPLKHAAARALVDHWAPAADDLIGVPALSPARSTVALGDQRAILTAAERSPDTARVVEWLGAGPVLIVPLLSGDQLLGAITFVGAQRHSPFTPREIANNEALAARCALALEGARRFTAAHASSVKAKASLVDAEASRLDAEEARDVAQTENAAKDGVIATVSHELRSPLGAIANNVQILLLEICGPVTTMQRTVLDRIAASHEHVMSLIDQLLDLQRIAVGKMYFEITAVSVSAAVGQAVDMTEWLFSQSGVELILQLNETVGVLHTDGRKFTQIVVNLLANASKYTPAGGQVVLSAKRLGGVISVQVSDDGIGIDVAHHEAVFEPFMQVRDARHAPAGGAGLGLAISRQLARALGGNLTLESSQGSGSTFTLTSPETVPVPLPAGG